MASSPHLVYWHSKGGYHKHMCGPFFSTEVDHISRNGDTTCNHEDQHVNQFQWKKKSLLQFLSINSLHALLKKWKCPTILQWAFEHKLIKESKYYHAAFCSCMNWLHSFFSVLSNVKILTQKAYSIIIRTQLKTGLSITGAAQVQREQISVLRLETLYIRLYIKKEF